MTDRRVALVTGGGSGIGRAVALALARTGAAVVVAGRSEDSLAQTVGLIEAGAIAVRTDVTRSNEVARLVDTAVDRYGGLHVAVNCAGVFGPLAPLAAVGEDDWAEVVNTNLTGVWLSMKYEISHMRANGGGVIVNVASNFGLHVRPGGFGPYAATKAGVAVLTRTAAAEYIREGIRINAISPGVTDTAMNLGDGQDRKDRDAWIQAAVPIGRFATPEEVAAAVLWLAGEDCPYAVGADLVLDGGASA